MAQLKAQRTVQGHYQNNTSAAQEAETLLKPSLLAQAVMHGGGSQTTSAAGQQAWTGPHCFSTATAMQR
jgi:hypothetical protein